MPVNIHGKEYKTVAERLGEAHEAKDILSIITEILPSESNIVVKATIVTQKGTFTGISASNPSKAIERVSPYEVAETSAVGRALAFAGYAGSEIASAEELVKAFSAPAQETDHALTAICKVHGIKMAHFEKGNREWWSHKLEDGTWCNGKEYASDKIKQEAKKKVEEYFDN